MTDPTLFTPQVLQTRTGERLTAFAEWWWTDQCAHPSTDWCRFSVKARWNPNIPDPHERRPYLYELSEETP